MTDLAERLRAVAEQLLALEAHLETALDCLPLDGPGEVSFESAERLSRAISDMAAITDEVVKLALAANRGVAVDGVQEREHDHGLP